MCVCACSDLWGAYISLINHISRDLTNWTDVRLCVPHIRLICVKYATKGATYPKYLLGALFVNGVPLNWEKRLNVEMAWDGRFQVRECIDARSCAVLYNPKIIKPRASHDFCNTHLTAGIRSKFPEQRAIRTVGYQHRYNSSPGKKAWGPVPTK